MIVTIQATAIGCKLLVAAVSCIEQFICSSYSGESRHSLADDLFRCCCFLHGPCRFKWWICGGHDHTQEI